MRCTKFIHAFVALTGPAMVAYLITQSGESVHDCSHLMGKGHLGSLCCRRALRSWIPSMSPMGCCVTQGLVLW